MAAATDYLGLIQTYFPPDQVQNALCILDRQIIVAEINCPGQDPAACVVALNSPQPCGPTGQSPLSSHAYGLWGIVGGCWDPGIVGDNTPFTPDEWAAWWDPNANTWLASVVYSIGGWRAWTVCSDCPGPGSSPLCIIPGEPIPYPRHWIEGPPPPPQPPPPSDGGAVPWGVILGGAVALVAAGLVYADAQGRR